MARRWWSCSLLAAIGLLIACSIVLRPIDHDEGQYVGAIALMRHGWPYRDFAYLQTPLQPLLLAPLSGVPAGWLLVATRVTNGCFALTTVALLLLTLNGRVRAGNAGIAVLALASTEAFLFAASLARNDTLPMMLLAGAILALLRGIDRGKLACFAIGGFLLGLAVSTKISAILMAGGAGVFLLIKVQRLGCRSLSAFAAGLTLGLLPTIVMAAFAPVQFRFDVFAYSLDAPQQWWSSIGQAAVLEPGHRILHLIALSTMGCVFVALATAAFDRRGGDDRLLLDLLIVSGLVAAY
ncbi:MAG: glycosyltransferase family 39 protein, partial [Sphingomonadales bacterium]|nr:glycosyltransferase family 39 protein [Sphingomonadales bacterium]